MENLVKAVQRGLRLYTLSAYADKAFHHFKLDVIEDRDILAGASDGRTREEFRALILGFNLCDEERFVRLSRSQHNLSSPRRGHDLNARQSFLLRGPDG